MKTLFTAGLFFICIDPSATAQFAVTNVFTHRANAATSKSYTGTGATGNYPSGFTGTTYTYQFGTAVSGVNSNLLLDSFAANGANFHFQSTALVAKFRRVNNASATGLRKSLWFEQVNSNTASSTVPAKFLPDYDDSLERIFSKGNILNIGMDNNFQNANTTNNNNIERVDYIIPTGVRVSDVSKAGFAVFDRGGGTSHDPFYIAAIKTLDVNGDPASYFNAVSVSSTNYGNNIVAALNYIILRKNPGEPTLLMMNNSTSQNLDGTLVRFNDLGVTNNTLIYGYSLFAPDVIVSPAANMVDYTNGTNFPTTTNLNVGGLDQVAIAGLWLANNNAFVLSQKIDNFSAQRIDDKVQLSWSLGEADGLKELIVERSADGKSFAPLVDLYTPAAGQHSATDNQPLPGQNYYRLRLVNMDDKDVSYSPVSLIAMDQVTASMYFNVYPNPAIHGKFTLHAEGLKNDTYTLRLFDMNGDLVVRQQLAGTPALTKEIILPERPPPGAYTLLLTDGRGTRVLIKTIMLQ